MSSDPKRVQSVFLAAVEVAPADRTALLDRECGEDRELRQRVETLLKAHDEPGGFLQSPPPEIDPTMDISPVGEGPGAVIGTYRLMEKIGEGGMGVVFVAEQQEPVRRKVALKIIKPGMDTKEVIARFEAERQALALMDHPNIARVFDAGSTESGRPYFVMELVRGVPITDYCDTNNMTTDERLAIFLPVCQAIQHAHQKGIIHRDIKPTNVMVTLHDGTPVPKIIDFGVAKAISQRLTERTVYTRYAQMVGTPLYMSPEQAEMSGLDIDTRSDVYSLGVLLYELLTGATPLDKRRLHEAAYDELLRIIREEEPPKPSTRISSLGDSAAAVSAHRRTEPKRLGRLLRGDLDWIVMKALEKDRTRRYETANGFAADVQRYLSDEPVVACPPSAMYRFRKFARRNKAAMATVGLVAAALVVGLALSTWQAIRATKAEKLAEARSTDLAQAHEIEKDLRAEAQAERDRAVKAEQDERHERQVAQEQRDENRRLLYGADVAVALQSWEEGHVREMLDRLGRHRPGTGQKDLRGFEWYYMWRLAQRSLTVPCLDHVGSLSSMAFSPRDDTRLAAISEFGGLKLWDVAAEMPVWRKRVHQRHVRCIAYSPDGRLVVTAGGDWLGSDSGFRVKFFDAATGDKLHRIEEKEGVQRTMGLAFSPDGTRLAMACYGRVRLWDVGKFLECLNDGAPIPSLFLQREFPKPKTLGLTSVAFAPSGKLLAFGDNADGLTLCEVETGRMTPLEAHDRPVGCVAFSPDGATLASGDAGGTVRLWNVAPASERVALRASTSPVFGLAFSPDGRYLASSSRFVTLWDTATARKVGGIRGHASSVSCLAFASDGKMLATGGDEGMIRLWRVASDDQGAVLTGHGQAVSGVAFSRDGATLASTSFDGKVKLWDALTGIEYRHIDAYGANAISPAFSPDGRLLVCGCNGAQVDFFDATTGSLAKRFRDREQPGHPVWSMAFSPDGEKVASGDAHGFLRLWDVRTGELDLLADHADPISGLAFSPDGSRLAAAIADLAVVLWDRSTGKQSTIDGAEPNDGRVAFSPDGRHLAFGSIRGILKLWDADTRRLHMLTGHRAPVVSVVFSPDGTTLFSGASDGSIKLWEVDSRRERTTLVGVTSCVNGLAISPDGTTLAAGSGDKMVRLWRTAPGEDRQELARRLRLEHRVRTVWTGEPDVRHAALAEVKAFLAAKVQTGLSAHDRVVAISTARGLEKGSDPEWSADALLELAALIDQGDDPNRSDLTNAWKGAAWSLRGRLHTTQDRWEEAVTDLTRAISLNPDDLSLRGQRRKACVMLGRWKDAAQDVAAIAEHTPDDQYTSWGLAALQLLAGDTEGYKRTCSETFSLFSEKNTWHQGRLVMMCSMAPTSGLDRAELTAVADRALGANDRLGLAKGMDDYRCGRYEQALTHLPTSGDARNLPLTLLFQAMAHHRLGHTEQARQLLARGIATIERKGLLTIEGPPLADYLRDRWIVWCIVEVARREAQATILGPHEEYPLYECIVRTSELVREDKLSEATKELTQIIAQHPDEPQLIRMRGSLYVRQSRWKEAAADYAQLVELEPTNAATWEWTAPLFVLAEDQEGYRDHCRRMLDRFADTRKVGDAGRCCEACLLLPGIVEVPELPLGVLETALDDGSAWDAYYKWGYTTRALVAHRTGDADKTVHWIRKSQESQGYADEPRIQALALSLLALGQHQLGRPDKATEALAEADALIEEYLPKLPGGDLAGTWPNWLIAKILHREATQQITGPPKNTTRESP